MPVLHEYNKSYHKSGYYVKVNWSAPHPYPLQTPSITERIYLGLGFEPGDNVPNELTSRLFNVGLHWTEGSGVGNPQKQTNLESITDTDIPELTPEQIDHVINIIDGADDNTNIGEINVDALSDLKSEIEGLGSVDEYDENKRNEGDESTKDATYPGTVSNQTIAMLNDLTVEKIDHQQAIKFYTDAKFPNKLTDTVYQFARENPLTPRNFTINSHGDPTFLFQSGPIEWVLADCRAKSLDFDWAITILSQIDDSFEIRISSKEVTRILNEGEMMSNQQASNLITIFPCLLWAIDTLKQYQLSENFNVENVENVIPSPQRSWFDAQVNSTLTALKRDIVSESGIVIDIPDRFFARIRTRCRSLVCTPVNSLPDSAEVGSIVSFQAKEQYGVYYSNTVSVCDDSVQEGDSSVTLTKEDRSALLSRFLESTPFDDETFPEIVNTLQDHYILPESNIHFKPLRLAMCLSVFYKHIDAQNVTKNLSRQKNTTVLFEHDVDHIVIGNEYIWDEFSDALASIPEDLEKSISDKNANIQDLFPKALTALSERQFYMNYNTVDKLASNVFHLGLQEENLNVIYVQTP